MNKKQELSSKYWNNEVEAFSAIYSEGNSKLLRWLNKRFRRDMFRRFDFTFENSKPIAGKSFLDIGCGTGIYSIKLAEKGASLVVGIDIADKMILECKKTAEEHQVQNQCTFYDVDLLEFKTDMLFDISFAMGVLDYIKYPEVFIKKMKSLTKNKVIISFPSVWTWKVPIRMIMRKFSVFFYTKRKIKKLMEAVGFKRYKIEKVGVLYCVIGYC